MGPLLVLLCIFAADILILRYDIINRGRSSVSRPFMFVFDRLQVVGGGMDGWDSPGGAPPKKCHLETDPLDEKATKHYTWVASDEEINDDL